MDTKTTTVGVIIGRFQLHRLHSEHIKLIEFVLDRHSKVILFLGVSDAIGTRKNPLDFMTRKLMLEETFGSKLVILPLKDRHNDVLWSSGLDASIRDVFPSDSVTLYGSKDSFIPYYHGRFTTQELQPDSYVNATDIREACSKEVLSSEQFRAGAIYNVYSSYPTMYSTVDAAIVKEGEVLLGQKPGETQWRFLGGFVDVSDSSDEHAVRREVHEESGLEVGDVKFICSQKINDWRYKGMSDRGIMTHFYECKYVFGGPQPSDDICALKWFPISQETLSEVLPGHQGLFKALLALQV